MKKLTFTVSAKAPVILSPNDLRRATAAINRELRRVNVAYKIRNLEYLGHRRFHYELSCVFNRTDTGRIGEILHRYLAPLVGGTP